MRNVVTGVLLAALLVVTFLYARSRREPAVSVSPAEQADEGSGQESEAVAALRKALVAKDNEIGRLRRELTDARAAIADPGSARERRKELAAAPAAALVPSPAPGAGSTPIAVPPLSNLMGGAIGSLLSNIMAQAVSARPRSAEERYADFVRQRGLGEGKARQLYELLSDRPQRIFASDASGVSAIVRMGEGRGGKADDEAIKALLGEDGFQALDAYEATLPARDEVARFESQLAEKGITLADDQRSRLTELFQSAGEAATPSTLSFSVAPGESVNDAAVRAVDTSVSGWDGVAAGAKDVLQPNQQVELDEFLGRRLAEREAQANMAGAIISSILPSNIAAAASVHYIQSRDVQAEMITVEEPGGD